MHRRRFLKHALGLAALSGAPAILAACSRRGSGVAESPQIQAPPPFKDLVGELERRGRSGLQVFQGASEFIVGPAQRIPFRLDDEETTIVSGRARMWLGRASKVTGPHPLEFISYEVPDEEDGAGRGFWQAKAPMPGVGVVDVAVEATDKGGTRFGFAVIEVKANPTVPAVGEAAVAVPTATDTDPKDSAALCTREPACGLHSQSLDAALASGAPTVLMIGSPKLCSSGVCGPVLEEALALKAKRPDLTYVHVEPYRSLTSPELVEAARSWRLPSEPWTFVIGRDGKIAARFEGPAALSELEEATKTI